MSEKENISQVQQGGLWSDAFGRLMRRRAAVICFAVIVIYFVIAGFVWASEVFDFDVVKWQQSTGESYERPSLTNLFGTDMFGQSILRKTIYGAKSSLSMALFALILSIFIGVFLGVLGGFFRGFVDEFIVWLYSTLSSVPYILLILSFAVVLRERSFFGIGISGNLAVALAIGLTSWVGICRVIRAEVIRLKEREYIAAAVGYGCGKGRIIFSHIMPNIFHLVIVEFTLRFVRFIHAGVILSFLGLGDVDNPSWGVMINDARLELSRGVWWQMASAISALFAISLVLNIFSGALRDALDPKMRGYEIYGR